MKATIDITARCNLRCAHCYNRDKYFSGNTSEMSNLELMDVIQKLASNGCDEVNFLGGEPLIRDNIIDVLRVAKHNNMFVSITTNATLINQAKFEVIFRENLVDNLLISLDGADAETNDAIRGTGVFNRVMSNLSVIKKWRAKYNPDMLLGLSHCVFKQSMDSDPTKLIDICKEYQVDAIGLFTIIEAGAALDSKDFLYRSSANSHRYINEMIKYASIEYPNLIFSIEERPVVAEYFNLKYVNYSICPERHIGCGVLNKCIYIKADGSVLPCGFVEFKKGFEEQDNGTFSESEDINAKLIENYLEVYNTKLFKDFIFHFNKNKEKQQNIICKNCKYKSKCIPCPYQNKNGEIQSECADIMPKLIELIEQSQAWRMEKIFDNTCINGLFAGSKSCAIGDGYRESKYANSYREYLNEVINYEKKGLIKISRTIQ